MPGTVQASLQIQPGTNPAPWINTTGSNNQPYTYLYSGGTDGNGDMTTTVGNGAQILNVDIEGQRFTYSGVEFTRDDQSQLSINGNTTSRVMIKDKNDAAETDAYYCVVVNDTQATGVTVKCDPMITNLPKPPQAHIAHKSA